MRAVVLLAFGGPERLVYEVTPTPTAGPGEVLVKVHAVSVNRTFDIFVRTSGASRGATLPLVLGADPSGEVVALGEGVTNIAVGDRVATIAVIACGTCPPCKQGMEGDCLRPSLLGVHRWGGYAEYVAVPARNAIKLPASLPFSDATFIVRHVPAALHLAIDVAVLQPGEWVLVMGAAGALGSSCVQVAKLLGAHVIAAAGSDERVAAAKQLGADAGVNYRAQDLARAVEGLTEGRGVDVVLENVGDPTLWPGAFESLAMDGRLVTAGAHAGGVVSLDLVRLYRRRLRIIGATGGGARHVQRALAEAAHGTVRPFIDRVLPLREAAEAHRLAEGNSLMGKVLLDPTLP